MAGGTDGLTALICRFLVATRYDDIPPEVVAVGKGHILDSLGCALAGSISPSSALIRLYLAEGGGAPGQATVLGTPLRLQPRFAAFANGAAIHADDFDDTAPQARPDRNGGIHVTGTALAAALALAETKGLSGAETMAALHVGVEVACKLNHAIGPQHHARGFHATSTIGIFGAAAAAARILGLDTAGASRAFGIAASQSAGLRENFGTMTNHFHSGHVAESGLVAAELAARGFTAATAILEGKRGFLEAYGGGFDPDAVVGRLGNPWAFVDPGTWIKPYPCGSLTHPAVTALIDLVRREDLAPGQIASVRIRTNRRVAETLIHNRPRSGLEAKFSMPYAAAASVLRRRATLAEFTDEEVANPEVRAMVEKIDYGVYDAAEPGYTNVTTLIEVALADGRRFSIRADFGKGTPQNPMSFAELAEKFRGCAAYAGWPDAKTEKAIDTVAGLDRLPDIRALTALLSRHEERSR